MNRPGRSTRSLATVCAASAGLALLVIVAACTEGVTPDCTGANAETCGPSVGFDAAQEGSSLVVPEASTPLVDAGSRDDASDASRGDGGDGG